MKSEPGRVPSTSELAHRAAIEEVLSCHSRGLDRLDAVLLASCYWQEAEVDYGTFKGSAQEFAAQVVPALEAQYQLTQHTLSNSIIVLGDDEARIESCVTAFHLSKDAREDLVYSGRYLDRCNRRQNQWKISHRQVVMDWCRRLPVEDERDSNTFAALAKGGHRGSDPSYPFFATDQMVLPL
jgi:hypothetical protein